MKRVYLIAGILLVLCAGFSLVGEVHAPSDFARLLRVGGFPLALGVACIAASFFATSAPSPSWRVFTGSVLLVGALVAASLVIIQRSAFPSAVLAGVLAGLVLCFVMGLLVLQREVTIMREQRGEL